MLKSAILAAAAAGLIMGHAAPASANAAMSGATTAPSASKSVVIDVRRGRGGGYRGFRGGGARFHRGGGVRRMHRGGRYSGGYRHRHRHRGYRYRGWGSGIYLATPYVYYGGYYGYGECGWLRRKAVRTGSRYWWRRYNRCRNYYY